MEASVNGGVAPERSFPDEHDRHTASSDPHLTTVSRKGGRPSILILFSDTGAGHRAAAGAIEAALLQANPQARVVLADPLTGPESRWLSRRICSSHASLVKGTAIAWGLTYRTTNSRPVFPFLRTI